MSVKTIGDGFISITGSNAILTGTIAGNLVVAGAVTLPESSNVSIGGTLLSSTLNSKANVDSPTFTGTVTLPASSNVTIGGASLSTMVSTTLTGTQTISFGTAELLSDYYTIRVPFRNTANTSNVSIGTNYNPIITVDGIQEQISTKPVQMYAFTGAGTADSSGYNNNLIITTGTTIGSDVVKGGTIKFVGSQYAYANTASVNWLSGTGYTLSFDFKYSLVRNVTQVLRLGSNWPSGGVGASTTFLTNVNPRGLIFEVDDTQCRVGFSYQTGYTGVGYIQYPILPRNIWFHIDIVFSPGPIASTAGVLNPNLYVNNVLQTGTFVGTQDKTSLVMAPLTITMGNNIGSGYGQSTAEPTFANLRITPTALTEAERQLLVAKNTNITAATTQIVSRNTDNVQFKVYGNAFEQINIEKNYSILNINSSILSGGSTLNSDSIVLTHLNFVPDTFYSTTINPKLNGVASSDYQAINVGGYSPTIIVADATYVNLFQLTNVESSYNHPVYGYGALPRFPLALSSSKLSDLGSNDGISLSYVYSHGVENATVMPFPKSSTTLAVGWCDPLDNLSSKIYYDIFRNITINKVIISINTTFFLGTTSTGVKKVFACGLNTSGQLGLGNTTSPIMYPQEITYFTTNDITITDIAAAATHSVFLSNANIVYTCGLPTNGRLGNGIVAATPLVTTPTTCSALTTILNTDNYKITAVAAGDGHTVFLGVSNATSSLSQVYGCGLATSGQLGNNTAVTSTTGAVTRVLSAVGVNLTGINAIACGSTHTLFIKSDNTVLACGLNANGQLGCGGTATTNVLIPVPVVNAAGGAALANISKVSCGTAHTVFLSSNNISYTCGLQTYGRLGNGLVAAANIFSATEVSSLTSVATITDIMAGGRHSLFLDKSAKKVYGCGQNDAAQLGLGNIVTQSTPVVIPALNDIAIETFAIASSDSHHSGMITTSGKLIMMGYNNVGQLGVGDIVNRDTPLPYPVEDRPSATNIIDGLYFDIFDSKNVTIQKVASGNGFTLFLGTTSTDVKKVFACGLNTSGQLGLGNTTSPIMYPQEITYFTTNNITITDIACGSFHSVFLSNNNIVYTCGLPTNGRLGNGIVAATPLVTTPTTCSALTTILNTDNYKITAIAAAEASTMFLGVSNATSSLSQVYGCGLATNGQLGNNTAVTNATGAVTRVLSAVGVNLTGISKIACGSYHTLFLKTDGTVLACGLNTNGQIGNGGTTTSLMPTSVLSAASTPITGISAISAGTAHSIFLSTSTDIVRTCGLQTNGRLGNGSVAAANITYATTVSTLTNKHITDISAVGSHSLFLTTTDNVLYSCGLGTSGQLGIGSITDTSTPTEVPILQDDPITVIGSSSYALHTIALTVGGTAYVWGDCSTYATGLDSTTDALYPKLRTITEYTSGVTTTTMRVAIGTGKTVSSKSYLSIPNVPYNANTINSRLDIVIVNSTIMCYLNGYPSDTITLNYPINISTNPFIRVWKHSGFNSRNFGQIKLWTKQLSSDDFIRAGQQMAY